jgi:predicted MFS family arabinose efflux permease
MLQTTTSPAIEQRSELGAGWRLLLAAMLGMGFGFPSLAFNTIGIFAPVLAQNFGWSFGSILGALSLTPVALILCGPLVGYLVDRHGARTIAALSLAGLGASYISLAFSGGSLAQYYVSWIAMAVLGMGSTPIVFTRAINASFVKRRGLALGIALAGIGLSTLLAKPLAAWLQQSVGWRGAIVALGLLPLVIGTPIVLWGMPTRAAGSSRLQNRGSPAEISNTGLTVQEALRSRAFWTLILAFVPMAFALAAPLPNMENILRSSRLEASQIVVLTSLIGATMVAGRLLGGWLLDQAWAPLIGAIFLLPAAFGIWALSQDGLTAREAMVAIVLIGFASGLEVDLLPYLVARYIGVRSYGVVYGIIFGLFAIGPSVGPGLLGHAYDRAGSYSQALQVCAVLTIISACLLVTLGRYPDSSRRTEEAP